MRENNIKLPDKNPLLLAPKSFYIAVIAMTLFALFFVVEPDSNHARSLRSTFISLACIFFISPVVLRYAAKFADTPDPKKNLKDFLVLNSPYGIDNIYLRLQDFAGKYGYNLEKIDKTNNLVIFSSEASAFSYGFYYLVYLEPDGNNTLIKIGIKSKLLQIGPVVKKSHKDFYANMQEFLGTN